MKNLHQLDKYRRPDAEVKVYGARGDEHCGIFDVPGPGRIPGRSGALRIIASAGAGWDHVSVSLPLRCPTWQEMEHVKRLFFEDHETAMQLHVPPTDHVNAHPNCLHLWRPHGVEIPRPPSYMVA